MPRIIFLINLLLITFLNAKETTWIDKFLNTNENKFKDKDKIVTIKVKEQCHIKGNEYFSNNLFSPIIDTQYDLLIDTRDLLYPAKIDYILFEPFGWTYYSYNYYEKYHYDDNESNIFSINDDNIVHFNFLRHGEYSSKFLSSKRIKQIVKSDLELNINGREPYIFYDGSLKKEEKKCNTNIAKQLNEKMIKDIVSTVIFILLSIIIIFILKVLKNKIFNKNT